jgi:hypothetical protein
MLTEIAATQPLNAEKFLRYSDPAMPAWQLVTMKMNCDKSLTKEFNIALISSNAKDIFPDRWGRVSTELFSRSQLIHQQPLIYQLQQSASSCW